MIRQQLQIHEHRSFQQLQKIFRKHIEEQNVLSEPKTLYGPLDYALGSGGKHIRPVLSLAAFQLFSSEIVEALPLALAIEMFHTFTLIHDDVMDDAALRRGKPTVYKKYGLNAALLSGDAMLLKSYEQLNRLRAEAVPELLEIFNATAIEICEGQQLDIDFENEPSVTVEQYLNMIRLKTAILLGASLQMGAVLGGGDTIAGLRLYQLGCKLGMAFQIKDDVLDLYGKADFGKQKGGDVVQSKKTVLVALACELIQDDSKRAELLTLYNESDAGNKVERVRLVFDELHIESRAIELAETYYKEALNELEQLDVEVAAKEPLLQIIGFLEDRNT